jgi:hypothetical protein
MPRAVERSMTGVISSAAGSAAAKLNKPKLRTETIRDTSAPSGSRT